MATLWGHVMLSKKAFEQGAKIDAAALQQSHAGAQVELTCNGRGARWALAPGDAAAPQFATVPLVGGETVQLRVFVDRPPPPREEYPDARVLVVGAGGIGCELLKNLALLGIPHIETIDLDTIDGTNLNRQFLFQMEHVGKSKAAVAADVVSSWGRPNVYIKGYAGNIKDTQYTDEFFSNFSIVINGLDNVSARKHVNRMCVAGSGVPLVESGTMGYNGQVQPIIKGRVECYDCSPKATEQKTFAVCTIHARPTTMVHCVHYAKELYARLFGDAIVMADEDNGGVAHQQQKSEFDQLSVDAAASSDSVADLLYTALFVDKIKDMLALQTHWTIKPPVPLPPVNTLDTQSCAALGDLDKPDGPAQLLEQLRSSVAVAKARGRVPFDKDDDDAVRFVSAIANLRAATFHIANESLHRVKTIAGNIVPAIASTNAVIAACAVDAAMSILRGTVPDYVALRHVAQVRRRVVPATAGGGARRRVKDQLLLHTIPAARPNPKCLVCSASDRTFAVQCNASMHTLATFIKGFLMREMGLVAPTVDHGSSTIYEHEDFEDLAGQPLSRWVPSAGAGGATPLTVGDLHQSVEWTVYVSHNGSLDETGFGSDWTPGAAASSTTTTPQAASNGESVGVAHADDDDVVAYHPAAASSTGGRAKKAHRVEAEVVDDD